MSVFNSRYNLRSTPERVQNQKQTHTTSNQGSKDADNSIHVIVSEIKAKAKTKAKTNINPLPQSPAPAPASAIKSNPIVRYRYKPFTPESRMVYSRGDGTFLEVAKPASPLWTQWASLHDWKMSLPEGEHSKIYAFRMDGTPVYNSTNERLELVRAATTANRCMRKGCL